jgi:hypothetical protein
MNISISRISSFRLTVLALAVLMIASWNPLPAFTSDRSMPLTQPVAAKMTEGGESSAPSDDGTGPQARPHADESYGQFPLRFEANRGQTDSRVRFLARAGGYNLFLTPAEAVLAFGKGTGVQSAVRLRLHGANPRAEVRGVERLPGRSNYFIGNDPSQWRVDIPSYAKVHYSEVYPGIDLVYYGNQARLEYDFVVAPGADPAAIRLQIKGARRLRLNAQGDLVISSRAGEVRLLKPVIYQEVGGAREVIKGRYVLLGGKNLVGFEVAAYDKSKPLIIDPIIEYATFLGGSDDDRGLGVAVDPQGNAYIAGLTTSYNFLAVNARASVRNGAADAFVTKLSPAGSIIWSTYYGGSGHEQARGIAVDAHGDAYITGVTDSANLPRDNNNYSLQAEKGSTSFTDAFVAKLSADGTDLLYSTYLGGWRPDTGDAIAVDAQGSAYVTGNTGSYVHADLNARPFPVSPGAFQTNFTGGNSAVFVTKLTPTGNAIAYSTFLGGLGNNAGSTFGDAAPDDLGLGIGVNSAGEAVITGRTESEKFPVLNAAQPNAGGGFSDAFVTKLNSMGTGLIFSTFLGGAGEENRTVGAIAVGTDGHVYLTGATNSTNFPVLNAIQPSYGGNPENEAFVTKLDGSGQRVYSTYLGSSNFKRSFGIAVDPVSNVFVTGTNLLRKISADGTSLVYSRTLGGEGRSVALDAQGGVYVTGITNTTVATKCTPGNFCPSLGAPQQSPGGGPRDAFVVKFATDNHAPTANAGTNQTAHAFESFLLNGSGSTDPDGDELIFEWKDADGIIVGNAAEVTDARGPGTYTFTLTVSDRRGGFDDDTVTITVEDNVPPVLTLPGNITAVAHIPAGATVQYTVTATDNVDGALTPSCNYASPHVFKVGNYTVNCTATDSSGNTASGSFQVKVIAATSISKNVYIDFEQYPGDDGVYGTGDANEGCTQDGQDIASRYAGMGVNFELAGSGTPVINQPAYEYIPGSPRTLRPMKAFDYSTSPSNQRLLKDFDILFTTDKFGDDRKARRVKLTALNADEAWELIGYDASGVEIARKRREAGGDRSVRSLEIVAGENQSFSRVRVDICNGSDSCGGEGPESFDLLEFEPVVPPVFSNTRFVDFEKHPGADMILGTPDDTNTEATQSISGDYQNLGVVFQLRDGTAPVIRNIGTTTNPQHVLYPVSAPSGSQTLIQDLIINFTTPVSRVKFAALDADEAWDVKVYSTSGALIRSIHKSSQGNGAVYFETHVDPCSAPENLIGRVEIIPTKSSECCHSGPEFYDLLEFDVVDLVSPTTTAALTPQRHANTPETGDLSVAFNWRAARSGTDGLPLSLPNARWILEGLHLSRREERGLQLIALVR